MNRCQGLILTFALAGTVACGGPAQYVNQGADLSAVKTVAVLPFENLTTDKLCSVRVEKMFLTELLALDAFQVVEPGEVARALRRDQLDVASLAPDDFKRLGTTLKAEAFFVGTVLEYEEGHGTAQGPKVRLQLRLIDAKAGVTVWSASPVRGGVSLGSRLFGLAPTPASDLAQDAIHAELVELAR